jgi:hypothetical protein
MRGRGTDRGRGVSAAWDRLADDSTSLDLTNLMAQLGRGRAEGGCPYWLSEFYSTMTVKFVSSQRLSCCQ